MVCDVLALCRVCVSGSDFYCEPTLLVPCAVELEACRVRRGVTRVAVGLLSERRVEISVSPRVFE